MLETIHRKSTEDKPEVVFKPDEGKFLISGRSMPENANTFYDPLAEWMTEYAQSPQEKTEVEFRLDYFNSASNSKLVKLLICLEDIEDKESRVKVIWHYHEDDDLMKARGEELESIIELPFVLVSHD